MMYGPWSLQPLGVSRRHTTHRSFVRTHPPSTVTLSKFLLNRKLHLGLLTHPRVLSLYLVSSRAPPSSHTVPVGSTGVTDLTPCIPTFLGTRFLVGVTHLPLPSLRAPWTLHRRQSSRHVCLSLPHLPGRSGTETFSYSHNLF